MKDCKATLLETVPLDPRKLPNYVFGMVLGPTDFRQVLENFDWKQRNSNLLLHGSGTVCGLKVSVRPLPDHSDVEIVISAGFAISPRGRWIRVEPDQCAQLNKWVQAQAGMAYGMPGPGPKRVYVTLCYNQCLTDLVPIAGQQCCPDSANQAPSRILESFSLQFTWAPPPQPLEDRARVFGALMRRVEIVDSGSLPMDDDSQKLLASVRTLALDPLPSSTGSLPDVGPIQLESAHAEATLREALTIWVTEVCPAFRPRPEVNPLACPAADDCLLLAAVDFNVDVNGQVVLAFDSLGQLQPDVIDIDETQRPVLVPSRLLQESLIGAGSAGGGRTLRTGTLIFAPGGSWASLQTVTQPLPDDLAPDASIELSVEGSDVPLGGTPAGNVALTLFRPPPGSLPSPVVVAATYLSGVASLTSVTVRWRAWQG
jgi:hypothetical protein